MDQNILVIIQICYSEGFLSVFFFLNFFTEKFELVRVH